MVPAGVSPGAGWIAVQLTRLLAGTTDLSNQIQNTFGTTHLAPFGTLEGTLCQGGITAPLTQSITWLVHRISEEL
jgi:hypothetical protein